MADDLTNAKFGDFPINRRKRFVGADTKWIILEEMIFKPKEFFDELQVEKAGGLYRAKPTNKGKKRKLGAW